MIKLTLTEKGGEPKPLTFEKDEITIGRVSGNDIVLAKGNVSKRHSRFTAKPGGQIEVADLKSTNGTYVNGRKITAPTMLSANDRVYVGDFLITLDAGEGEEAADASRDEAEGASGRLPVPPPPPPPRATGSRATQMPAEDESDAGYGDQDEDELGLAARPPRSGRMPIPPPPPPPPPRRPPTPLASRALDKLDDDLDDLPPAPPDEDTGSVGLFAHSRAADDDISRKVSVGARPGAPAAAPTFAPAPAAAPMGGATDVGNALGLEALLADTTVRQVLITAPDAALVDRGSGLSLHDGGLGDPNAVADALWRLANTAFPPPAPDNPVVDVRLPDGSRMTAAFPPAAPNGVVAAIRRPALVERELRDLLPAGGREAEALLSGVVTARRNVLVTGDVSAVSAALGALGAAVPADRRVVAIGAASPQSRGGWMDLAPSVDAAGLLRVAAGFNPDHLVLGELVGTEIGELALLAARGQDGILAALPGRSPGDVLTRLAALATLALAGSTAAAALAATTFDLIIQVVSVSDGTARIVEIAEPRLSGGTLSAETALAFGGDRREPGGGRLDGRGVSSRLAGALAAAGSPLSSALVAQ